MVTKSAIREVRERLQTVAAKGETVHYDEIAELADLSLSNYHEREQVLPGLLGDISRAEHEHGRPLLSVVVVLKGDDRQPGKGFFTLARELGRTFDDEYTFFLQEHKAVSEYWKKHGGK